MALLKMLFSVLVAMPILEAHSSAIFTVEKGSFTIVSPLSMQSRHDSSISKFGIPDSADLVVGSLLYPLQGGGSRALGCRPFASKKPSTSNSSLPTVFLLDRGDCYFGQKIWNSQEAGAHAVLIADNIEEPLFDLDFDIDHHQRTIYSRIRIPSALITKSLGEMLKMALHDGEEVIVRLEWRNPGGGAHSDGGAAKIMSSIPKVSFFLRGNLEEEIEYCSRNSFSLVHAIAIT